MNTHSPGEVARRLGGSRSHVNRAADALGLGRTCAGRRMFSDEDLRALSDALGAVPPVAGLSRVETLVLGVLAHRPLGLVSARAVARAAGISPASASKAVKSLMDQGLVVRVRETVALGRARRVSMVRVNPRHPRWNELMPALRRVRPPSPTAVGTTGVPGYLRHAFWNIDDDTFRGLDLVDDGAFVAARALSTGDPA